VAIEVTASPCPTAVKEARDIDLNAASERYFDIKNLKIASGARSRAKKIAPARPSSCFGDAVAKRLRRSSPLAERADRRSTLSRHRRGGAARQHPGIPTRSLRRRAGAVTAQNLVNPPGILDAF